VHFSVWRYCNRLFGLLCLSTLVQPTMRSALSVDTTVQSTTRSTLPVDITTDYLLYRLSTILSLVLLQSIIYCDLLGLSILQPTFLYALFHSVCQHHYNRLSALASPRQRRHHFGARQSDDPLNSVWRYSNRLSGVLLCSLSLIVNAFKLHDVLH
jgi:hypothetical protein